MSGGNPEWRLTDGSLLPTDAAKPATESMALNTTANLSTFMMLLCICVLWTRKRKVCALAHEVDEKQWMMKCVTYLARQVISDDVALKTHRMHAGRQTRSVKCKNIRIYRLLVLANRPDKWLLKNHSWPITNLQTTIRPTMSSKQSSTSGAVLAASTCAAVAFTTAALRRKRVAGLLKEEKKEQKELAAFQQNARNLDTTSIWRKMDGKQDAIPSSMTIETQGSTDSADSLLISPVESMIDLKHQPSSGLQVKDFVMVAAWMVLLVGKISFPENASTSMPPVQENRLEIPDFVANHPAVCLLEDTTVEMTDGVYGPLVAPGSIEVLEAIHQQPISDLSGVYGALVIDAPFTVELNVQCPVWDAITERAINVSEGIYGHFVNMHGQAFFDAMTSRIDSSPKGVYGPYVGMEHDGWLTPQQSKVLETFAELQRAWTAQSNGRI